MAENKKSFIAYSDWKGTFDALSNDKAGELIKHIFAYVNDEDPISEDMLINAVFSNIKNALKRDLEKWGKQHQQRKDAGKKSAEVRKQNATTVNERSISSTVSVSVSDSVTVNETNTSTPPKPKTVSVDWVLLLKYFNDCTGKKSRIINDSVKAKFKARFKEGYSKTDIMTTIKQASQDDYHKENNFKYLTIEYVSRSEIMERYTSMKDTTRIKLNMNVK